MINLADLASRLQDLGLINKSFMECTREEIIQLCEAVFSCPDMDIVPENGWEDPYFKDFGNGPSFVVGFGAHPAYQWWKPKNMGMRKMLLEFKAPFEVAQHYLRDLTEEGWNKELEGAVCICKGFHRSSDCPVHGEN